MASAGDSVGAARAARASAAAPVIDVHSHFIPLAYWKAIEARVRVEPAFAEMATRNNLVPQAENAPMRLLAGRTREMDDASVDISVLSLPPPGVAISPGDTALTQSINDELVAAAMSAPQRLRAMCALPLPDVRGCLDELERISVHPLVRGVAVTTNAHDWRLDDDEMQPLFDRLAEADLPLFVHPALEPLPDVYADYALRASVAAVMSSTLGVLRMIYVGVLDRAPRLTVIMPHLGGVIPYLLQRLTDLGGQQRAAHPLRHYLEQRLIFDTCSYHPPAFRCALDTVGAGRLTLGSDYPFRGSLSRAVADVRRQGLRPDEEIAVLGGTVARWFA